MDSAWIQRPVKLIQSDSAGVIIIQTDSDKFQKNSDRFSLIQNFLFMRGGTVGRIYKGESTQYMKALGHMVLEKIFFMLFVLLV